MSHTLYDQLKHTRYIYRALSMIHEVVRGVTHRLLWTQELEIFRDEQNNSNLKVELY